MDARFLGDELLDDRLGRRPVAPDHFLELVHCVRVAEEPSVSLARTLSAGTERGRRATHGSRPCAGRPAGT